MSGLRFYSEPSSSARAYGYIGASQVFDIGDPLISAAGLLVTAPTDGTELLVADDVKGFAIEPAEGIRAQSRPADSATPALAAGFNGPAHRSYVRLDANGLLMATANFWATGAPGTPVVPAVTDIGVDYQLSAVNAAGGAWGVEQTAGVPGTDIVARIVDILNADGLSIAAGQPGFGTTGVEIVFAVLP